MADPGAKTLFPGPELLKIVRAGLIMRGTTLHAWCHENGVHRPNITNALLGGWRGPKGRALAKRIAKAAGVGPVRWQ